MSVIKGKLVYVFEGTGQEIEQVEFMMKQELPLTNLKIDGCRTEATSLDLLNKVLTQFTENLKLWPEKKIEKIQI